MLENLEMITLYTTVHGKESDTALRVSIKQNYTSELFVFTFSCGGTQKCVQSRKKGNKILGFFFL